jgi:hypothetical protein
VDGNYRGLSYHALPSEIRDLISSIPELTLRELRGCEGLLGGGLDKKVNELPDDEFQAWVQLILETGMDEAGLSNSDHLLAVTSLC